MQINWSTITTVLGVVVILMPVLFGFIAWKLMSVFVLRSKFDEFEENLQEELKEIKGDVKRLLQRRGG